MPDLARPLEDRAAPPPLPERKPQRPHILVVDDDRGHRLLLARLLDRSGFRPSLAADAAAALKLISAAGPDLVLLDVMLPGEDGLALCRRVRAISNLPIIMLTALGQGPHRVAGLDAGADDYVAKPFDPDELLARVRAVLRRARDGAAAAPRGFGPRGVRRRYRFAGWTLDVARREVWSPQKVLITLTSGEFDLLLAFCDHPEMVLTREHLVELTTGKPSDGADRRIDILVSRIRAKLAGESGGGGDLLKTVRNGGYQLTVPVTLESGA
ncbi:MAG TPA: response regulator transcription factor [Dongiaceae bacterium]|jgi:two-component system OmpR family response regulator|nr:response regulator transcription factor [Dongiaceae bacterium]